MSDNVTLNDAVSGEQIQQAQVENTEAQGEIDQKAAADTSEVESETSTSSDDTGESEVKPKKGFEKRISKVVSERDRARQELEFWREQALKAQQTKSNVEPTMPQAQVGQYAGKPSREMFDNDDAYFEALSDYKVEQRLQQREIERQRQQLVENYNTRAMEFAKERPDFFDIIDDAADLIIAPETAYIIQSSDQGPKIALYLAENPEEAERLNRLDATRRVYELGKIESKLTTGSKKPETKKVSEAPKPLNPVKGSAPVTKDLYDPTLTTAEWVALRSKKSR